MAQPRGPTCPRLTPCTHCLCSLPDHSSRCPFLCPSQYTLISKPRFSFFYCVFLFLEDSLASPILFSVPSIFHGLPFYFPVWGMVTLGRDTDYVHEHSTLHMRCSVQSLMRSASPTLKSAHSRDCFTAWEASSYLEDLAIFGGNWDLISISFYATVNMVLLHLWGCVGILW